MAADQKAGGQEAGGQGINVSVAALVDDELHGAVAALVPQLSSSAPPPTLDQLRRIIEDPATTLLLATTAPSEVGEDADADGTDGGDRSGGRVVGMLTLAIFLVPTGLRAWIEDVVVDERLRGAGVASALIRAAVDHAERQGARTVDLTSRPQREAANRLYVRLGFERRDTNVYRKTPEGGKG
jgi:ribosomal protein S18 acetylase RimI-like enzyme